MAWEEQNQMDREDGAVPLGLTLECGVRSGYVEGLEVIGLWVCRVSTDESLEISVAQAGKNKVDEGIE